LRWRMFEVCINAATKSLKVPRQALCTACQSTHPSSGCSGAGHAIYQAVPSGSRFRCNPYIIIRPADKNMGLCDVKRDWYVDKCLGHLLSSRGFVEIPEVAVSTATAHAKSGLSNLLCSLRIMLKNGLLNAYRQRLRRMCSICSRPCTVISASQRFMDWSRYINLLLPCDKPDHRLS
jgi:hypothetical protein